MIKHQNTLKNKNKIINDNIRVMCWRFIIFGFSLTRKKKKKIWNKSSSGKRYCEKLKCHANQ